MSAKNNILDKIKSNLPDPHPVPNIPEFEYQHDLKMQFREILEGIGAKLFECNSLEDIPPHIQDQEFTGNIVSSIPLLKTYINDIRDTISESELSQIELAIIPGKVAVAENGAIWIHEEDMIHRALPYITQHLGIVIYEAQLVSNMHEAYHTVSNQYGGYGVFISGPSKTADIEQSLVIGAHGARSLQVFMIKK